MLKSSETFPIAVAAERTLDRRRLLCAAGAAIVAVAAGEWGAAIAERNMQTGQASVDAVPQLAVGEARAVVDASGGEALVVQVDSDTLVAFDRRCPHLGCPVLWSPQRGRFECPCHHAAFDARSGAVLFGPPRRGLKRVELRA